MKKKMNLAMLYCVIAVIAVLIGVLAVPKTCLAGDVVSRVANTWTNAAGTNITAGLWESWDVQKSEFYGMPSGTVVAISVRYAVCNITQSVASVTGNVSGVASYSTAFAVVPGDTVIYAATSGSTGNVVTTYAKHNP